MARPHTKFIKTNKILQTLPYDLKRNSFRCPFFASDILRKSWGVNISYLEGAEQRLCDLSSCTILTCRFASFHAFVVKRRAQPIYDSAHTIRIVA